MSTPQITTVMTVPDSSQGRAAFVAAANEFGADMTPYAEETNVVAVFVNAKAIEAEDSANDALAALGAAEAARDAAIAASTAVASDYNPAGFAYVKNALVWDEPSKLYRCILAYNSTATLPRADPTHWARVNTTPEDVTAIVAATMNGLLDVPTVTKSGNLALSDRGKAVRASAQVNIPAVASVAWPDGTTIIVRNITGAPFNLVPAGGVTLRKTATTKTGTLSIPAHGTATLHMDATNVWYASGAN